MARLTPEQLEQKLNAVLRNQPPRRAPMSLEARVLGEIARRQALPWWHKSYAYWPAPMRVAFIVIGVALMAAALLGSVQLAGLVSAQAIGDFFRPATDAWATLRTAGAAMVTLVRGHVPQFSTHWFYVALAVIGAAYAMMLGLGATAYRVFWSPSR
ncbi:hypothetical protein [Synoicihabitans lomoniglobus]|uniref:Uncharacterized protein n=1 Tax=Synoicihabitans lomoniglobus TaxID=2909285 RepID=A0AAE9ZTQ2_9BACT|nr:hypothetical protein [Opitutaceae bacterium LMO-M01]WED63927.1 hypothetical protein PXH66_16440 [Opitutaceae bacterium LMO-M01]